jgi:tight adherence protein C
MQVIIAAVVFFVFLMASITVFGYRRYARAGRVMDRLSSQQATAAAELIEVAPVQSGPGFFAKLAEQIGQRMPVSAQDASATRRYMIAAGYRSEAAVRLFYGVKLVLCVVFLVIAFLLRESVTTNASLRIVVVILGGVVGYFGPGLYLERLVSARQERIRLSLPDALDLLVVCVEAGLGLDQAVRNVSEELKDTHKDISDELALVNLEMRAGKRRADALRNLADRTGEEELKKLVAILIQADRFGVSVADSLRTHSDFMRVRRRQDAEERAAKVGVKLVFPIFFFILPSMLVVAAGPGLLKIFKYLFPMMNQFGQ